MLLPLSIPALVVARVLTLADALALAEEGDARQVVTHLDEDGANLRAATALARMLPTVDANASVTRNAREVKVGEPGNERVVSPLIVPQAGVTGRLPLLRGPDLPGVVSSVAIARATHAESGEARDALRADVTLLVLEIAETTAVVDTLTSARARADERLRLAGARLDAGEAVPLEVAEARAELARLDASLAVAQGERAVVTETLRLRLALPDDEDVVVDCDACVHAPVIEPGADALDARRGDLVGLDARAFAARVDEVAHAAAYLPQIDVVGNARLQQPTLFNPDPLWWTAQLTLTWNIFGGTGPTGGNRTLTLFERDRAALRTRILADLAHEEARTAARSAALAHDAAVLRAEATALDAAASRTALDAVVARAREGEASALDLTFASRRALDAERAHVEARFACARAALAWRRALGFGPLDDGEDHDG